jgi:hypothetical protein
MGHCTRVSKARNMKLLITRGKHAMRNIHLSAYGLAAFGSEQSPPEEGLGSGSAVGNVYGAYAGIMTDYLPELTARLSRETGFP